MLDSVCERLPCAVVLGYGAAGTRRDKNYFRQNWYWRTVNAKVMQYCPCRSIESRFHARILKSPFKILLFWTDSYSASRSTGIFMALSNRNQSTDLFHVIPFNAVAFVLTAVLLANISYLFALIVLLCIDVSIHSPFSPFKPRTLKRESLKFIIWHQF